MDRKIYYFVEDLISNGDTTNENYYVFEEYCLRNNIDFFNSCAIADIKRYANQLMWINLTLQRAVLTAIRREQLKTEKKELLNKFKEILNEN